MCNHAVKCKGVSFRESRVTIFLLALPNQGYSNFDATFLHLRGQVRKDRCSEQGAYYATVSNFLPLTDFHSTRVDPKIDRAAIAVDT